MGNKIAFFLPTRKGSERVRNKNTRPFAGIEGGLIENKIRQLVANRGLNSVPNAYKCQILHHGTIWGIGNLP